MRDYGHDIEQALAVLREGGIILYPTDTIWGIGCDATNDIAVEKIYTLKQRPPEKSMIILVADERDILQHVAAPDPTVFEFLEKQDRPTTVVYEGGLGVSPALMGEDGSIAIRVVQDDFCRELIRRLRKPLVSTSANVSGDPSPGSFGMISRSIRDGVDYIVHYRQEETTAAVSSRLVRWKNGKPEILRP